MIHASGEYSSIKALTSLIHVLNSQVTSNGIISTPPSPCRGFSFSCCNHLTTARAGLLCFLPEEPKLYGPNPVTNTLNVIFSFFRLGSFEGVRTFSIFQWFSLYMRRERARFITTENVSFCDPCSFEYYFSSTMQSHGLRLLVLSLPSNQWRMGLLVVGDKLVCVQSEVSLISTVLWVVLCFELVKWPPGVRRRRQSCLSGCIKQKVVCMHVINVLLDHSNHNTQFCTTHPRQLSSTADHSLQYKMRQWRPQTTHDLYISPSIIKIAFHLTLIPSS